MIVDAGTGSMLDACGDGQGEITTLLSCTPGEPGHAAACQLSPSLPPRKPPPGGQSDGEWREHQASEARHLIRQ